MDSPLSLPLVLLEAWYRWGVAIGLAVTLVTACWIFYDSQRRGVQARIWRLISLVCAMAVAPSAVLFLFPDLVFGLGDAPFLIGYMGALATLTSAIGLILYTAGVGVVEEPMAGELQEDPLPLPPPTPADATEPVARVGSPVGNGAPITEPDAGPPTVFSPATVVNAPEPPLAWLVVMSGPHAGREYRLTALTDIGRDSRYNDISINDPAMSRQHARVRLEGKTFVIYDLASVNGVYVNNQPERRRLLEHGDRITLGQTLFGFMQVRE